MAQTAPAPDRSVSDRQDAILDAAFHAFATYGFRRASMEDIARGANLSRTALYLRFRSKEDIFRSLAERYFDEAVSDMATALATPGRTVEQALASAFVAKDGKFMDAVLGTPHGSELMDAGFTISGDLAQAGEARMVSTLADWLHLRPLPDGIGTPQEVAATIMTALKGLKSQPGPLCDYRTGQARLARLFARAIDTSPRI